MLGSIPRKIRRLLAPNGLSLLWSWLFRPTWRQRFIASVRRTADPRALVKNPPMNQRPGVVVGQQLAALLDSWRPAPRPVVSFVLATYNRIDLLMLAVQSIRNQDLSVPYEIIIIDGGSSDGSIEWLVRQNDIITVAQHNRSPESGGARRRSWGYFINLGFRLAQGKWVCMLSDDCLLLPGAVSEGLRHIEGLEAQGRHIGGGAFYFRDWPKDSRYFIQHTLGGMPMVNHGFFLKEALIDVGYAEEDLYSFYKADSDLSLKIWDAGYEIVPCPGSYVEHLLLPAEELRILNNKDLERDRELLIRRWAGRYVEPLDPELFNPPYQRYSDFQDKSGAVEQFAPFLEKS